MERKVRDVKKKLTNKFGFAPAPERDRSHEWYVLTVEGETRARVMFSHGEINIGPRLQGLIARQLKVQKGYFDGMIDCRNSRDDYLDLLGRIA